MDAIFIQESGEDEWLSWLVIWVLRGLIICSVWVRMALQTPAHFPGHCKQYWYGVHGPNKTSMASFGSERNRNSRLGFTRIRVAISSMYSMWSTWMVWWGVFTYLKQMGGWGFAASESDQFTSIHLRWGKKNRTRKLSDKPCSLQPLNGKVFTEPKFPCSCPFIFDCSKETEMQICFILFYFILQIGFNSDSYLLRSSFCKWRLAIQLSTSLCVV